MWTDTTELDANSTYVAKVDDKGVHIHQSSDRQSPRPLGAALVTLAFTNIQRYQPVDFRTNSYAYRWTSKSPTPNSVEIYVSREAEENVVVFRSETADVFTQCLEDKFTRARAAMKDDQEADTDRVSAKKPETTTEELIDRNQVEDCAMYL